MSTAFRIVWRCRIAASLKSPHRSPPPVHAESIAVGHDAGQHVNANDRRDVELAQDSVAKKR
jgi:hypothetical protein